MASEIGLRQAYSTIKSAYRQKQRNPVTTASDLRLVVPMSSTKTNYSFPVLVGDDPQNYSFASLLNRADAFTATEIGLFVGASSAAGNTDFDWYSYGNPNPTGMSANIATAMKNLFNNSSINIAINNVQYLQNFSTLRLRRVPIAQTGQTYGYGWTTSASNVIASNTSDSFNGEQDGYYPLVPTLQLSGTSKIDIQLLLPTALTAVVSGTPSLGYIMLAVRGFLSLGASNLNK
jgi:type II secretory pathway pseudopilin PulG